MSASQKAQGLNGPPALVAMLLRAIGGRMFRRDDTRARQHGWQVKARHGGLSRSYRDQRFDLLRACLVCRGTGMGNRDRPCDCCSGTGRVTLAIKAQTEAGRAR